MIFYQRCSLLACWTEAKPTWAFMTTVFAQEYWLTPLPWQRIYGPIQVDEALNARGLDGTRPLVRLLGKDSSLMQENGYLLGADDDVAIAYIYKSCVSGGQYST